MQVFPRVAITILDGTGVAGHHGLVTTLIWISYRTKDIIARESHAFSIDDTVDATGELGLSRHPVTGQIVATPVDHLPIADDSIDLQTLNVASGPLAVGGDHRVIIIIERPLDKVDHPLVRPDFCATCFSHVFGIQKMVAVHVGNEYGIDRLDSELFAGGVEYEVEEFPVKEAAVDQNRMPIIGNEHVKIDPVFVAANLVEVRRDLP